LTAAAFAPPRTTNTANASRTGRDVTEHLPVHGTPLAAPSLMRACCDGAIAAEIVADADR